MACAAERDDGQHVCRLGWMEFRAGQEVRSFVAVPEGARWAELRLRAGAHEQPRCRPCTLPAQDVTAHSPTHMKQHGCHPSCHQHSDLLRLCRGFMVRATWLQPQTRYSDTESRAYISLQASPRPFLHLYTNNTNCVSTAEQMRRVSCLQRPGTGTPCRCQRSDTTVS